MSDTRLDVPSLRYATDVRVAMRKRDQATKVAGERYDLADEFEIVEAGQYLLDVADDADRAYIRARLEALELERFTSERS